MPDLIILRLHPSKPMAPSDFKNLISGLTITAYDLSFGNSVAGDQLGTASGLANPHLTNPGNNSVNINTKSILQHYIDITELGITTRHLESVATAVVIANAPAGHLEYPTPTSYDLRLKIANAAGSTIAVDHLDFNVSVTTVASLSTNQKNYFAMGASAFVRLPATGAALDPNLAFVDLPADGQPPPFGVLRDAIDKVLSKDPGSPNNSLVAAAPLTPAQSKYVAAEIMWNRTVYPPPQPDPSLGADPFGALYTDPPVDPTLNGDDIEKARGKFDAEEGGYYGAREAAVLRMAGFVYSAGAAIAEEKLSIRAERARVNVPLITGASTPTTIPSAGIALTKSGGLVPAFIVPAAVFYALGATMPSQIDPSHRFDMARLTLEPKLLTDLQVAADASVLSFPVAPTTQAGPGLTIDQTARRLASLGATQTQIAAVPLAAPVDTLISHWLAYTASTANINTAFWTPEIAAAPAAYLQLTLKAVTGNHQPLIDAVTSAPLNVSTIAQLVALTDQDWRNLFLDDLPPLGPPPRINLLPPWTQPGTPTQRAAAFVRSLHNFFSVQKSGATTSAPLIDAPPTLPVSISDVFAAFVAEYPTHSGGTPFSFGQPADHTTIEATAAVVLAGDDAAQAWLIAAAVAICELWQVSDIGAGELRFSLVEALYARGFTSAAQIAALSAADLQFALTGSVAYQWAAQLYAKAGGAAGPKSPPVEEFSPVNPDGSLVDCVPPPHLSPLGPVEFLRQMLLVSSNSTRDQPFDANAQDRLGALLAGRRRPLGALHATAANLATPLPLIDLVNENLENMVTTLPAGDGAAYDTARTELAGHLLATDAQPGGVPWRHDPQTLFAALPEHSSPAAPVAAPTAYQKLRNDFSAPALPYSQPLDINRSYLEALRTSRFQTIRLFRRDITEFAISAAAEPADFPRHQWRYPVRLDIALEYLHISAQEYDALYAHDLVDVPEEGHQVLHTIYGFSSDGVGDASWTDIVARLPEFLRRTGLSYCEFLDLWRCGFATFGREWARGHEGDAEDGFPECEPCCLDELVIDFGEDVRSAADVLRRLAVFLRLWRALQASPCTALTMAELADIASVLKLFDSASHVNKDFVRQLAALMMLRELLCLPLHDPAADREAGPGAGRSGLLALWVGPAAASWQWALDTLVERVEDTAEHQQPGLRRQPELTKLLVTNLDALSVLAGFDLATGGDTWYGKPTSTLRFAEVLLKIYLSNFTVGEVLYLFSNAHLDGDDPFALPTANEAADDTLELPDDDDLFGLWALRDKLLQVEVDDSDAMRHWSWARIAGVLADEFGCMAVGGNDPITVLGEHFFPSVLQREGWTVTPAQRRFTAALPVGNTTAAMWNTPPDSPFRYDTANELLSSALPLHDREVAEKLSSIRPLGPEERAAVQSLYFAPRALLAQIGFMFADFATAADRLIETGDEDERFNFFVSEFARLYRRCQIIAEHLAEHVVHNTGGHHDRAISAAETWRLLRTLHGDENTATADWENDSGTPPPLTWPNQPTGGAFAAILGLLGTGLRGEFSTATADPAWRDVTGPLSVFADGRDHWNAPVVSVIPSMALTLTDEQLQFVAVRNGFALRDVDGEPLMGAQPFTVQWRGVLLVEQSGRYEFAAGGPTPEGEDPSREHCPDHRWQVTIRRGQKTWQVLNRDYPGDPAPDFRSSALELRRGCYELTIALVHAQPDFTDEAEVKPRHTGFQLKYAGPDTDGQLSTVPHRRLYRDKADGQLISGLQLGDGPTAYLTARYTSSLRDVRRTYQRAFKSALLAHRFELSARPLPGDPQSELGYLLNHPQTFAGRSYYRTGPSIFATHQAWLDLDLLPTDDPYYSPIGDQRAAPSARRQAALFDTWERLYDYCWLRAQTRAARERPAWRLFYEASERQPDNPAELVRHLGIDVVHAPQVLTYFAQPDHVVDAAGLESEAWAIRAWRAELWLDARQTCFHPLRLSDARPHRWAADDPAQGPDAGNENLTAFVLDGALETGPPRRYRDIEALNDGLRVRARDALVAWLCAMHRVSLPFAPGTYATRANDLADFLLQDVSCGTVQRASRIEDAISAVQAFVQRARLGVEPGFAVDAAFSDMWDGQFATFADWRGCAERKLHRENWISWDELLRARRVEAFSFLEDRLRRGELTVAVPGSMEWWPGHRPPTHPSLTPAQENEWSQMSVLTPGPLPEGLDLLNSLDRDARPSWLAPISRDDRGDDNGGNDDGDGGGDGPILVRRAAVVDRAHNGAPQPDPAEFDGLPLWLQAAVRLGHDYVRVAAAGVPPASAGFRPCQPDSECCCACGEQHEALVDEYYFWLQPGEQFADIVQDADTGTTDEDQTSDWHRAEKLPALLVCNTEPVQYLYWCRLRHGEFEPPRRSAEAVVIDPGAVPAGGQPQLLFTGRSIDSLHFTVTGAVVPFGHDDPAPPGFRYDLATDSATVLPLVAAPPPVVVDFPGGLSAYPYFAYVCPGAPVEPLSLFSVAETVAGALRTNCRFEAALKWYELVWPPLISDNSWTQCGKNDAGDDGDLERIPARDVVVRSAHRGDQPCCDQLAPDDQTARQRAVLLAYVETLIDWTDALMCGNSPEAFGRAEVVLGVAGRILGMRPATLEAASDDEYAPTVDDFDASAARLNPRLVALYGRVQDRVALIHSAHNSRRLSAGRPVVDMPYFTDHATGCGCGCEQECACGRQPYRFRVLADKAASLAADTRALGGELLSAFEKGDGEFLAALHAAQERQLAELTIEVRENQLRDADWQVQALGKSKEIAQSKLRYFQNLIAAGKIAGEIGYETLTGVSMGSRTAGNVSEAIAQGVGVAPDFWIGVAGIAGTPLQFNQLPMGSKLAGGFATAARILNALAEIASSGAQLSLTEAGWDRREADWRQEVDTLTLEIEQIERQILGADRRRDQARRELDNAQRAVENAVAVQNFLRDKFTSHQLYLYLQRETAALHKATYALAREAAEQAQRAFNYELGHVQRTFVPDDAWDSLHEGLLAGDRLGLAIRRMDKAYLDNNCREYELTKHISMRLQFPLQFLALQASGVAEIELPEWMFDVDYPGHYMRRIRNVSLTIPGVVGPYTGVHCRLTLLSSTTRIDPQLPSGPRPCCDGACTPDSCGCATQDDGYAPSPDDPRIVRSYAATEAIATSSGQNDGGVFELNFRDDRYLPFEFAGAVSRWRIELPPETNFFDLDTLADVVLHVNYTAREGGGQLAAAAAAAARCKLPGDGIRLLDVRRDLPDAWAALQRRSSGPPGYTRSLDVAVTEGLFPFVPVRRVSSVVSLHIVIEAPCAEPGGVRIARFFPGDGHHHDHRGCDCDRIDVRCVATSEYPGLFYGVVDLAEHGPLGPIHSSSTTRLGCLHVADDFGEICDAYLIAGYCADRPRGCGAGTHCPCGGRCDGCR